MKMRPTEKSLYRRTAQPYFHCIQPKRFNSRYQPPYKMALNQKCIVIPAFAGMTMVGERGVILSDS